MEPQTVTALLEKLTAGQAEALDELIPQVYSELNEIAHRHLRGERPDHTLNTTALVHEAYVRLVDVHRVQWQGRAHFFAMASRVMRRVLVDHARSRGRQKRGGAAIAVTLDEAIAQTPGDSDDLLALDEALTRLEALNKRQSRVVECRVFAGLGVEETAAALGISPATVKRDWTLARAWLNAATAE